MQLVRITHIRCRDYDCVTFILAPDEWPQGMIYKKAKQAQDKYEAAIKVAKEEDEKNKPEPKTDFWYAPNLNKLAEKFPEKTATEILEIIKEDKKAHDEWKKKQSYLKLKFADFLQEEGFYSLYSEDVGVEVELDWGHQHGTYLDYGREGSDRDIDTLPTPKTIATPDKSSDYDEDDFS